MQNRFDVDFSLSIHNRTGKFFIGRDIILDQGDLIEKVRYWRLLLKRPPSGLFAKIVGRAQAWEDRLRGHGISTFIPEASRKNPVLHLDPATAIHSRLKKSDVVLCHDLGPLTHPDLFNPAVSELYKHAYRKIAERQPRMVFVSQASRDAYSALFAPSPDMKVIYPPIRTDVVSARQTPVAQVSGRYFLTVGSVGRRKNQLASIEAFARSDLAAAGWSYVICGAREPGSEAIEKLASETKNVVLLKYVSDSELSWLYANAKAFILVSQLEGFGVPVAEAIAYGLVPLVTGRTVLEEVAGPGAVVSSHADTAEISDRMLDLAAMSDAEVEKRRRLLTQSITRFTRQEFSNQWRAFLTEVKGT